MKTLILWLDALRGDYITQQDTPFLHSLAKKWGMGTLSQPFGYTSIATSFFTGMPMREHRQLFLYRRLSNARLFGGGFPLDFLPPKGRKYFFNLGRYLHGSDFFGPVIPPRYSRYFSISQDKFYHHKDSLPVKTLFNLLDEKGISYVGYNWPLIFTNQKSGLTLRSRGGDRSRVDTFMDQIGFGESQFCFLHLTDLDEWGHEFGPHSTKLKQVLKSTDMLAEKLLSSFSSEEDTILIWSDHGMLPVTETVDLQDSLPPFGEGYQYFLDSTMARFWFSNDKKRAEVIKILEAIPSGKIISLDEKRALGIDFDPKGFGEETFLLNPGGLIFPNFFQTSRPVKGMHGYDVANKGEKGVFILNKSSRLTGSPADLNATLNKLLGIRNPPRSEGSSLLYRK